MLEKPRPNTKRPGEPLRPSPLNIHKQNILGTEVYSG